MDRRAAAQLTNYALLCLFLLVAFEGENFQHDQQYSQQHVDHDHSGTPDGGGNSVGRVVNAGVDHGVHDVLASLTHSLNAGSTGGIGQVVGGNVVVLQHQVAAVADGPIGIHVVSEVEAVGDDHTAEAPLAAQHAVQQCIAGTGPLVANIVPTGHDGLAAAHLGADLEGTQVDLADSLLVSPGAEQLTLVGLLVVQGKVLHVSVDAVALGTGNGAGTDVTGEDAVLRVIFEVTAVKGGTVAVHGGGVPAGDVHLAAKAAQTAAETAKANADTAASNAAAKATAAAKSAVAAKESETSAGQSATAAANSATAAAASATAAAGDAKTASDAAAGAADAKAAAVAAQKDATASKAAAANSSAAAKTSEDAAAKSAADADSTANSIKESMTQIAALQKRQNVLVGSETGNPVSCDDAFAAPLCGLYVYGKSTQDGTPSPDTPVPIVSAGDGGSVVVKVTGKNRMPPNLKRGDVVECFVKKNTPITLVFKGDFVSQGGNLLFIGENNENLWFGIDNNKAEHHITLKANATKFQYLLLNNMASENVCLTWNASSPDYEPYREQLLTLPTPNGLPGIPVASGGNYTDPQGQQWLCDEVDLERGVKVLRIDKGAFDATKALAEQSVIRDTPIETPLTPAEIAAYKALTAYAPDTVVQTSDGTGVKLEYQRDVNIAIKKLEDAIASMTAT